MDSTHPTRESFLLPSSLCQEDVDRIKDILHKEMPFLLDARQVARLGFGCAQLLLGFFIWSKKQSRVVDALPSAALCEAFETLGISETLPRGARA